MTLLRRTAIVDELVLEQESAVMVDDQVIVLSALATALLAHVGDGLRSVTELTEHLSDLFGPPAGGIDPLVVVQGLVDDLMTRGLLERLE